MAISNYFYDYTFNPKDVEYTTFLAKYYDLPRDEKGFLLWNKKYGEIPQNLGDYVRWIFSKPQNLNKKKMEDLAIVIQLRHMAAIRSYINLSRKNIKNVNSLKSQLEKILEACIISLDELKNKMGQLRWQSICKRRKELMNNTNTGMYEFFE